MVADLQRSIAQTLETDERLLPLIPELLTDLSELGSSAARVVAVLRDLGLGRGARAIDLGCGKGAVAVALAEQLGMNVDAVDGLQAFIEAARRLAGERGVAERCSFRCGDLRDYFGESGDYDVALLLSVGPVAGDHQLTVEGLRALVRPGGFLVIDDGFLAEGAEPTGDEAAYPGHGEMLKRLTAFGDRLVHETIVDAGALRAENTANTQRIRARALDLRRRHPELAAELDAYVARQELETGRLGRDLISALWVLERAP